MQFKKHLVYEIILGEKTQTRRPIKPLEKLVMRDGLKTVLTASGRIKIQVGRDYATTYGRGKPCRWWHPERCDLLDYEAYLDILSVENPQLSLAGMGYKKLRRSITDIHVEDARHISFEDSVAEGFENELEFWDVWCGFYDPVAAKHLKDYHRYSHDIDSATEYLLTRPNDLYQAFAYTFHVKDEL